MNILEKYRSSAARASVNRAALAAKMLGPSVSRILKALAGLGHVRTQFKDGDKREHRLYPMGRAVTLVAAVEL